MYRLTKKNRKVIADWVETAKSDKYKPYRGGALTNSTHNYFCIMGVFCEVHPDIVYNADFGLYFYKNKDPFWGERHNGFRKMIPLDVIEDMQLYKPQIFDLINDFDADRISLKQCADIIERIYR